MISTLPGYSQSASRRAAPVALLVAGAVAGFGVGALILAMIQPAPQAAPIPPLAAMPSAPSAEPAKSAASRTWAAAFGLVPSPAAMQPLEPVEEFAPPDEPYLDDDDDFDDGFTESEYLLRGMVNEGGGGWALIEGEMGIEVVRVGSVLSGGESVIEITQDGVVLQGYGAEFLLSFSEFGSEDEGFQDDDEDWFER